MFTIDANVWISAALANEPSHLACRSLIGQASLVAPNTVLPLLAFVEVAASVARRRNDAAAGFDLARSIAQLPFVKWIALDDSLATYAAELASTYRLRGADAIYAAVAQRHACILVSLDTDLLTRLPIESRAITPEQALTRIHRMSPG